MSGGETLAELWSKEANVDEGGGNSRKAFQDLLI